MVCKIDCNMWANRLFNPKLIERFDKYLKINKFIDDEELRPLQN